VLTSEQLLSVAEHYGTPVYVYDLDEIRRRFRELRKIFQDIPTDIHYAVKANANPSVIHALHAEGALFDTVSPQEIRFLKEIGIPEEDILFTPSCPSREELMTALESAVTVHTGETEDLEWIARNFPHRPVGIRLNPGIEIGGNQKIATAHDSSKFGIPREYIDSVADLIRQTGLPVKGLHIHLGSDVHQGDALEKSLKFLSDISSYFPDLEYVDIGGGFKVPYRPGDSAADMHQVKDLIRTYFPPSRGIRIKMEPGKFLTGPAGYLLMRVNRVKETPRKRFICVDSGFNHFLRPMYYGAYHEIENLTRPDAPPKKYDVVGYLCEEDTFAYDRMLPATKPGDILVLHNAGAYGMVMASRYNLRPLPKEVAVDGKKIFEV